MLVDEYIPKSHGFFLGENDSCHAAMPANLHQGLGRGEIGADMKTTADLKSSIQDWEQIPGEFSWGMTFLVVSKKEIHPSKVVSTHLWNTPLNLYQQAAKGILS